MNEILEQFMAFPRYIRGMLVFCIYVSIGGCYWYFSYEPSSKKLDTLVAQTRTLNEDIEKLKKVANDMEKLSSKVDALDVELGKAIKKLPNDREIDELLKRVSTIGKKIGLEFLLFQPSEEIYKDFYAEVPVKIEVSGSFHEVAMFFDRISKLSRIVNINDIKMTDPQERGGKIVLKTSGVATTYRFISDKEKAAMDEKNKKK